MTDEDYALQPFLTYFRYNFPDFSFLGSRGAVKEVVENGYGYIEGESDIAEIKFAMLNLKEKLVFIIENERIPELIESDILTMFGEFMENRL